MTIDALEAMKRRLLAYLQTPDEYGRRENTYTRRQIVQ